MTARARIGWRHGAEAGLAMLLVAALLWAGGMLDAGELAARPAHLALTGEPGAPRLVRVLRDDADVLALAWSPDSRRLASSDLLRRTVSVWDASTGARLFTLDSQAGGVRVLAWSPDGKYLATGRSFVRLLGRGVSIKLWDARSGALVRDIPSPFPPRGADNDVYALAWSPDGRRLASSYGGGALVAHDVERGVSSTLEHNEIPAARFFAYSADGRSIVSAGGLWGTPPSIVDALTGASVRRLAGPVKSPRALAWSADGSLIACAEGGEPAIVIWDESTARPLRRLSWQGLPSHRLAFHPASTWLASAVPGSGVHLWDPATGRLVHQVSPGGGLVYEVAVSPDGTSLAAAERASIYVWDLPPPSRRR